MFSWFRRKGSADDAQRGSSPTAPPTSPPPPTSHPPPTSPSPPSPAPAARDTDAADGAPSDFGFELDVDFVHGGRKWTEHVNLVQSAARVLQAAAHSLNIYDDRIEHVDSGYVLRPRLLHFEALDRGGVRTVTIVETTHPMFAAAGTSRVFEYQHSNGESLEDSITGGFEHWLQLDFATLLDAARETPEQMTAMQFAFPAEGATPARTRRVVFGPVAHFRVPAPETVASAPSPAPAAAAAAGGGGGHEHPPFCACCLFTNTIEAFRPLVESDGFFAIRLYAARDENDRPQADCRVNGEDFEPGAAALRKYVQAWPHLGFEFRKQYVVLHSVARDGSP